MSPKSGTMARVQRRRGNRHSAYPPWP